MPVPRGEQPPWIVSDGLWDRVEPLLPVVERRAPHPGRRRLDDRKVLCGILFVLHTGIQWEFLPQKLGFGSGMTCRRRLAEWNAAGVWQQLHELLWAELRGADRLNFSRAVIDCCRSSHQPANKQSTPSRQLLREPPCRDSSTRSASVPARVLASEPAFRIL